MRRWLPWLALVAVVAVAIVIGTTDRSSRTDAERADAIADSVRCPTCRGQSVADSDAPAAANVRNEIERRVAEGESDDEIRAALADRFGDGILLNPPREGVGALVWVLPVVGLVLALGGLLLAFRHWRRSEDAPARWGRTAITVGVVAVVAVGSGIAVAQVAGSRKPGETLTGTVPSTSQQRLREAADLVAAGDAPGAIEIYQELLEEDPEDVEALTYFGWLLRNLSLQQDDERLFDSGVSLIERASRIDPEYSEAWFFRGIIYLRDEEDPDKAVEALRNALATDPIPDVQTAARELLAEIAASEQT